jgi:hypothetical protein
MGTAPTAIPAPPYIPHSAPGGALTVDVGMAVAVCYLFNCEHTIISCCEHGGVFCGVWGPHTVGLEVLAVHPASW